MSAQSVAMKVEAIPESQEGGLRLRGPRLIVMRSAWVLGFLLCLTVAILSIYSYYSTQSLTCTVLSDRSGCRPFHYALDALGLSYHFYATYFLILQTITALPYFVIGGLIFWRRSNRLQGILFSLLLGLLGAAGTWFNPIWLWINSMGEPDLLVASNPVLSWVNAHNPTAIHTLTADVLTSVLYCGIIIACYTFPDGRFVPRWTRWLAGLWVVLSVFQAIFPDSPISWRNWPGPYGQITTLIVIGSVVYALLYRYRRVADPTQRQQLKWFALGLCMPLLNLLADITTFNVYPYLTGQYPLQPGRQQVLWELIQDSHWYLSSFIFAVCIGVIVFRYRLWDIDLIINRTLVYGTLSALVIGIYMLVVGAVGTLVQSNGNWLVSMLAIAFIALLVRPLRNRLQRGVNRLMSGQRDDPVKVTVETVPDLQDEGRRLSGPWLIVMRSGWFLGFLLCLSVCVLSIYSYYSTNNLSCTVRSDWPTCSPFNHALEQLGLSFQFYATYFLVVQSLAALPYFVIGGLIFWRRSNRVQGVLFSLLLALLGAAGTWFNPIWIWLNAPDSRALLIMFNPVLGWLSHSPIRVQTVTDLLTSVLYCGIIIACYTFPNGKFVPRWTRWWAGLWVFLSGFQTIFPDSPFSWRNWPGPYIQLAILTTIASMAFTMLYRYRQVANPTQRQQIKWFAIGITMPLLNLLADVATFTVYPYVTGQYPLHSGMQGVMWELIQDSHWYLSSFIFAICIGVIVFRYRLWDIDLFINRTLVYGGLTAIVVGLYILLVGALGTAIQGRGGMAVSVLAIGLVAVASQPLRVRVQQGVNRLMYGERDDPVKVLSRLGQRLEASIEPELVLPTLVETVAQALKLPYAAITLGDAEEVAAESSSRSYRRRPIADVLRWPLMYQGECIGYLLVAPRAPGEAFSPLDRRLLENIAHQAGAAVHAVRLTADLQRSRQRLVTAREEERRRLRRDLHDGLGPILASQGLKLAAAKHLVDSNPAEARSLLDQMMAQNETTVAEIRRLVYNLRPPALDERGLVEAVRDVVSGLDGSSAGSNGLCIEVESSSADLPALPAAVEVAAYRIALEALTNVTRYAEAQNCTIRFALENGLLRVEVADDGVGFPESVKPGVGLRSMRERAEELGGMLTIQSGIEDGTRIVAELPIVEES